ncbi:PTPLA-domain-containing protein [Nadsonia fulvescens var. elongata DSM 6958]|uniref:Very-long-chain (3R)-3-hydroxyacyl-CoA dehydratase n=1 Tax=Nadsonia fulvescens var. elongata DSM 6958 TaxID=857566 RepID=A0A1E3PL50_9ASCO|nr:PTPLA-domain-containing protein [Nadsonia fulvescens var. elongata DSM 6958]
MAVSSGVKSYLIAYNTTSSFLWFAVLARLLILLPLVGLAYVSDDLAPFTRQVQTLAILEIVHSIFGFVRSPIITTVIQISSRILLVWGILFLFPQSSGQHPAFVTMVGAWSTTEVIRYAYYAANLALGQSTPTWLVWLRYNTFYVLYPIGVASEMIEIYVSLDSAQKFNSLYALILKAVLVIYVPGFYVMFTHMVKQRKRVLKNLGKRKML